jgi:VanZ family protein
MRDIIAGEVMDNLRRAFVVFAIALTIILLWASVAPSAGELFAARHHRGAHLVSYFILAFAWRGALWHMPIWVVALSVVGFGFLQEGIEVFGHAHPYELKDALVDAVGAITGTVFAHVTMKHLITKNKNLP